jgi:hypothetical protein
MSKKKVYENQLIEFVHPDNPDSWTTGKVIKVYEHNLVMVEYKNERYSIHTSAIRNT